MVPETVVNMRRRRVTDASGYGSTAVICASVTDPATCPGFDHLALEVTRAAPPEAATITRLRCAID